MSSTQISGEQSKTGKSPMPPPSSRFLMMQGTPACSSRFWKCAVSGNELPLKTRFMAGTSSMLSTAQRPQEQGGILAALEDLDERRADDDAVGVRTQQLYLLCAPNAEAGTDRQARCGFDRGEILRRLGRQGRVARDAGARDGVDEAGARGAEALQALGRRG